MRAVDSQGILRSGLRESQVDDLVPAWLDLELIVSGGFCPCPPVIHGVLFAQHDIVVDAILDIRSPVGDSEKSLGVGLVLGEKERDISITIQVEKAQLGMFRGDGRAGRTSLKLAERRAVRLPTTRTMSCGTRGLAGRGAWTDQDRGCGC